MRAEIREQRAEVREQRPARFENQRALHHGRMIVGSAMMPQSESSTAPAMARLDPFNQSGDQLEARDGEWSLPLVSLPGRAGLDLGLTLSYSSQVWTRAGDSIYFDEDNGTPSPGFRLGFPSISDVFIDNVAQVNARLLVTSAGRRVELRQVSSNVYEAADSSYLQLTVNGDNTLTLRTTDGTQISYSHYSNGWQATKVIDRNGNYISITNNTGGDIDHITDTLGRIINFEYDTNANLSAITQLWNGVSHQWATFGWETNLTLQPNFSGVTVVGVPNEGLPVLTQVGLPDGSFYTFQYNSRGQVIVIHRYTSDSVERSYSAYDYDNPGSDCPRLTQTRVWAQNWSGIDGIPNEVVTQYAVDSDGGHRLTLPDQTVYKEFYGDTGWQRGLVTTTKAYASVANANNDSNQNHLWEKQTTTDYVQNGNTTSYATNPHISDMNIDDRGGNHRRTKIDYCPLSSCPFSLPTAVTEYAADGVTALRITQHQYKWDDAYLSRRIIGLPAADYVFDGSWHLAQKTTYGYDSDQMEATSGTPTQHEAGYGASPTGRGNLTKVTRWDVTDPDNTRIDTAAYGYNINGSVTLMRDALGHQQSVSYADAFSDGTNRNSFAYPTVLTDADGYQTFLKYDFNYGLKTFVQTPQTNTVINVAGPIQSFTYDEALRLVHVTNNINNAFTHYYYGPNWSYSYASVNSVANEAYAAQIFDGAGRLIETASDNPVQTAASGLGGFKAQWTSYDLMGRVTRQSNPVEIDNTWTPVGDDAAGMYFTYQSYDWKGRPLRTTNQDNTFKEVSYAGCGCAGGEVVTLTDEGTLIDGVTKKRQQKIYSDSLGRQVKSETLDNSGNVYSSTATNYNARDQVTAVNSYKGAATGDLSCPIGTCMQSVTTYDGYGRVATHKLPQQMAATSYEYNSDDTVRKVTDPRGVEATNTYNSRHLLKRVDYDPRDSGVSALALVLFEYDAAGNRTLTTDGTGNTSYVYDQLSRMTSESHYIADLGAYYGMSYGYNLAGELTSITDPAGAQVSYNYDSTGRLTGMPASGYTGVTNFLSNAQYRAFGAMKHATYGNNVQLNLTYNLRMQIGQYQLGTSYFTAGATMSYYDDGRTNTAFDLSDSRFDRKYEFDVSARLKEAYSGVEAHGQPAPPLNQANSPYRQSYTYDEWNNVTARTGRVWTNNDGDAATYTNDNKRSGYTYDWSGNVDYSTEGGHNYDAAGRPSGFVSLQNWQMYPNWPSSHPDGPALETTDTYDGGGQVVKHTERVRQDLSNEAGDGYIAYYMTDTTTTMYYVDSAVLGGKTIAELNQSGTKTKGYVYSDAGRLATQSVSGGTNTVELQSTNPVTGAGTTTDANGTYTGRQEPDPLSRDLTAPPDPLVVLDPLSVTAPGGDRVMPIEASWGPSQEFQNNNQAWANQMDRMQLRNALNNQFKATATLILEHNPNIGVRTTGPGGVSLYGQDALDYLNKMHGEATGTVISNDPSEFDPQNSDSLPCPPPAGQAPHQATRRFGHYREGSGTPVHMPIREINAPFPVPTAFPQVAKLVNQGTGQPFVQYEINKAHSDPIATSGQQSAYLGRITFTLSGILNVYMTGHYQFYGTIGVVDDLFDFNAETSSHKRTRFGELTVTVARQLDGKPFYNIIDGQYQVSYEGGPGGVTLSDCR
jgi:YD repeat-containing protein